MPRKMFADLLSTGIMRSFLIVLCFSRLSSIFGIVCCGRGNNVTGIIPLRRDVVIEVVCINAIRSITNMILERIISILSATNKRQWQIGENKTI